MTGDATAVLEWISNHMNLVGWPLLVGLVWRFRGKVDGYFSSQEKSFQQVAAILETVEIVKRDAMQKIDDAVKNGTASAATLMEKINILDTNHLTHMEHDIREQTKLLVSIDKNIAVLAERTKRKR